MRFTTYQFKKLIRSYTFIPPYIVYMIWIAMLYVYSGQSILSSYASSTIVLLSVSAWLTINIYQLENNKERQLLFIQFNSKLNYLTHKLYFSLLTLIPLIIFSILYPIIFNRFSEKVSIVHMTLAIHIHVIVVIFGVLIGTFICIQNVMSRKYSWLLLILILLISIMRHTLVISLPVTKYILWLIPPVGELIQIYQYPLNQLISIQFLLITVWILSYIIIFIIGLYYLFSKSEYL
ncbi:hypothetical protein QJ528_03785 [Staphylococcus warneri]|uniref:hypothetical protein n=1 Tax=Staphylococcus warneri TaxID=1292 RepID=UPI002541C62C|nr:hypothetical protein [Staphylococcus warneri]MDK4213192.1 hypothetical protein [Staphylococcus warneri]MDU9351042.1 hypothetical protein [Staphylococcus warneri]